VSIRVLLVFDQMDKTYGLELEPYFCELHVKTQPIAFQTTTTANGKVSRERPNGLSTLKSPLSKLAHGT
ncbi:unnamed protein product, partial [Dovyalis caffra]